MGVHGLWELLAPVGRRVSVETLAGKRLAIDASIWMIQFMKAMRDENGEMVRNAHILGFFRRICKLLYLRTKPVFVFDGGTPALKRRTVIARRRHRENAQAKIRKTAEKLFLNQFKQMRLKELAEELERQRRKNDAKGKKVIMGEEVERPTKSGSFDGKEFVTDEAVMTTEISGGNAVYSGGYNQEMVDEMLAASLLVDEEGLNAGESSCGAHGQGQEEDAYEDEEMILPAMHGEVDPAILAALPPSMQLDLLVQMRERLMAENRQKYQKVKKVPSRFSELQILAYLKTVAFRREIDEVQRSAAGRGIGGVQTSRIASEANREFIFSSSFSGDKEVLVSAGWGRGYSDNISAPVANSSKDTLNNGALKKGKTTSVSSDVEPPREYENDVETYLDERGRVRVSRVRAMGIRMTRDLQRNLDLMKEIEEERAETSKIVHTSPSFGSSAVDSMGKPARETQLIESAVPTSVEMASGSNEAGETLTTAGTTLEITFENSGEHEFGGDDDDLFASLVAGDPIMGFSVDNSSSKKETLDNASELEWEEGNTLGDDNEVDYSSSKKQTLDYASDLEWEEGNTLGDGIEVVGFSGHNSSLKKQTLDYASEQKWEEGNTLVDDIEVDSRPHCMDGGMMDEKELEWEEGSFDQRDPEYSFDCKISKGAMEEEADFQEAIRRSLQDVRIQKSENASSAGVQCGAFALGASESMDAGFLHKEDLTKLEDCLRVDPQDVEVPLQVQETVKRLDTAVKGSILHAHNPLEIQSAPPLGQTFGETEVYQLSPKLDIPLHGASSTGGLEAEPPVEPAVSMQEKNVYQSKDRLMNPSSCKDDGVVGSSSAPPKIDLMSERLTDDLAPTSLDAAVDGSKKTSVMGTTSVGNAINEIDFGKESANVGFNVRSSAEREESIGNYDYLGGQEEQNKVVKARLEEEMLMLGQQQLELGEEQKKLERNAESVSSEMFAEAQELLQMFGLPYIIAPMEAEAQCAHMELTNLVDGVVTDDSDAFLFGACSVYKNIFDDRKYVETYFMKDVESELGLNREKLIRMALLLGSDYTEGISGIGIVNAIEVVNAFPEEDGLHKFREWIESPDPSILGKFEMQAGGEPRKRESTVGDDDKCYCDGKQVGASSSDENIACSSDEIHGVKQTFMDKHRNVSKNWHIPSSFPSDAVISAYASPQVDKTMEPFSWGKPDILMLRRLCWEKFGWSTEKANELLLPVLKEYDKRETQLRLEAFYTFNERFAKIRSKRIKTAVKGIAGAKSLHLMDDSVGDGRGSKNGRRINQPNTEVDGSKKSKRLKLQDAQVDANSTENVNEIKLKQPRGKSLDSSGSRRGLSAGAGRSQNRSEGQKFGGRAKGRGRGRGRGGKQSDSSKIAGFSLTDGSSDESVPELQDQSEDHHQVRRSERARKEVKYSMDESRDSDSDQETSLAGDENAVREDALGDSPVIDMDIVPSKANNSGFNEQELSGECPENLSGLCKGVSGSETREFQFGHSTHSSNDYFTTGGGFCLDEDEVGLDSTGQAPCPNLEVTFDPDPDHGGCSNFGEEEINANYQARSIIFPAEMKNVAVGAESRGRVDTFDTKQRPEEVGNGCEYPDVEILEKSGCIDNSVNDTLRSLRALPNLRRKKRKI